jgi:hypothetical protein
MNTISSLGIASLVATVLASCSAPSPPTAAAGDTLGDDGGGSGDDASSNGNGANPDPNASSNGGSGAGGSSSGSRGGSSGGAASSGGGSSSGTGPVDGGLAVATDADPGSDPEIAGSYTITTDTFSVPSNAEVFKCQSFANPFKGQQVDIKTWEANMSVGSHHMFVFYQSNATNTSITDCNGLQIQPFTFVAQGPHVFQTYPEGVGATIPTSMGFMVNVHFINSGATTLNAQVKVTMYVTKAGVVKQHAGIVFVNNIALSEPADGQPHTFSKTCALGNTTPITIVASNSHMHKTATHFTATMNGMPLYDTTAWSDPPMEPPPGGPMQLPAGASETFSCTYAPTGTALSFGESVNNIMCIGQAVFYPTQNISSPFLGCNF